MPHLEEEVSYNEHIRAAASEVSFEEIMEFELPDDLRHELLRWKLFDMPVAGTA